MSKRAAEPRLSADYFNGRSGRAQAVSVWLAGARLHLVGDGLAPAPIPARDATWPERQRHGQRQVLLPDGGVLAFGDAQAFDAWAAAGGQGQSLVVRWQQSWHLTALALVLIVACLGAAWRWGIPAAAQTVVAWLPETAAAQIGQQSLAFLDREMLKPSQLDVPAQAGCAKRFADAAAAARAATGPQPAYRIYFRDGGNALGPNAFALPGGDIVVTDALVKLLEDQPQALIGVLAHELGHVRHRHGLRLAVQAGSVAVVAGLVVGDFSALLAGAPALLAQMDYSRDFEREADAYARDLLRGAGIEPRVMVSFFERLAKERRSNDGERLPIAFSSHPADAQRIAFFSR